MSLDGIQRPSSGALFQKEWMRSACDRFADYAGISVSDYESPYDGATPPADPVWNITNWIGPDLTAEGDAGVEAIRWGPRVVLTIALEATASATWGQVSDALDPLPASMRPSSAVRGAMTHDKGGTQSAGLITVGTDGHIDATADTAPVTGDQITAQVSWTVAP